MLRRGWPGPRHQAGNLVIPQPTHQRVCECGLECACNLGDMCAHPRRGVLLPEMEGRLTLGWEASEGLLLQLRKAPCSRPAPLAAQESWQRARSLGYDGGAGVGVVEPGPWSKLAGGGAGAAPQSHQISTRKENPVEVGAQDKRFTRPHLVRGQLEDPHLPHPEDSAGVTEPS